MREERTEERRDKTYAQNAMLANKLDMRVLDGALGIALTVGLDVA